MKRNQMISRHDLLCFMEESGRPLTSRRLTDWSKKHLLQHPRSRGRGTGRGNRYWTEPDALERAQFIYDAYKANASEKAILLSLAWAGFEVSAKRIRRIWIIRLDSIQNSPKFTSDERGYEDDPYWQLAALWSPKLSDIRGIKRDGLELIIASVLKIIYAPRDFRPRDKFLADIVATANNWLRAQAKNNEDAKAVALDDKFIVRLSLLGRKAFSVIETKELLKGTEISQFEQALDCLQLIIQTAIAICTKLQGEKAEPNREVRAIFRALVGPTLLALILRLIADGHVKKIEKTKLLCRQAIRRIEAKMPSIAGAENKGLPPEILEFATSLFDEMRDIWRGYNPFKLYNIP